MSRKYTVVMLISGMFELKRIGVDWVPNGAKGTSRRKAIRLLKDLES